MWKIHQKKREREKEMPQVVSSLGEDGGDILGVGLEVKPLRAQPESVDSLRWVSLKA